jgi:steroid 5-alpha reductase family enzyme
MIISYALLSLVLLFGCANLVFGIYRLIRIPSIIDAFWSLSVWITMLGIGFFGDVGQQYWIMSIAVGAWALRLSVFLTITKVFHAHMDVRYTKLIERWGQKKQIKLYGNILFQGVLQWGLCATFYSLIDASSLTVIGVLISIGIIGISIICEWIADYQLYRHKQIGSGLCQTGLWFYSRHPNIFFEIMVWFGFGILGISLGGNVSTFIGCVLTFIICRFITCPYTERLSIEKYGDDYRSYQESTPMIFPKP